MGELCLVGTVSVGAVETGGRLRPCGEPWFAAGTVSGGGNVAGG